MSKKVRMVVEFEINEETIKEKGISAEDVLNAIEFHNHDTIDGFEIYPALDNCDLCSDFFLYNPAVVSKKIIGSNSGIEDATEDMMNENEISAIKVHLNNLEHELAGASVHDPDAVPAIEVAIDHALQELRKVKGTADPAEGIPSDMDAVFLPGKIHGCEDQLYIIYLNPDADNGNGCFEIEIVDWERILKLYEEVNGNAEEFFGTLPDLFHGEWYYCNTDHDAFGCYVEDFFKADFLCGRDGGTEEQLAFMVNWAKGRAQAYASSKYNK